MAATLPFTRADYDQLPEDLRVELIDGELLKMASPTMFHQALVLRIADALRAHAKPGTVYVGPLDFAIDDTNVLVPDVVALEVPPLPDATGVAAALVVVEILSPSTAARDRRVKAQKYLGAGVAEVWLVDPGDLAIEVRRPREQCTFERDERAESQVLDGFRLTPATLFAGRS
ncbi:MAG: Uma2 family endonuclease [Planctomycetota bacterium]|jgi:Uma2 family endonuclease